MSGKIIARVRQRQNRITIKRLEAEHEASKQRYWDQLARGNGYITFPFPSPPPSRCTACGRSLDQDFGDLLC